VTDGAYVYAILANIPLFLRMLPHWVGWRIENGQKVPYSGRTGYRASVNKPATWSPLSLFESGNPFGFDGVGLVLVRAAGIVALDLDHAFDPAAGVIADWAVEIVERFKDLAYIELSPSRTGLHIFGLGTLPRDGIKRGNIEMYCHRRYMTVTGFEVPGIENE
jgi:primase-polymerase (primpol)-like protein